MPNVLDGKYLEKEGWAGYDGYDNKRMGLGCNDEYEIPRVIMELKITFF